MQGSRRLSISMRKKRTIRALSGSPKPTPKQTVLDVLKMAVKLQMLARSLTMTLELEMLRAASRRQGFRKERNS